MLTSTGEAKWKASTRGGPARSSAAGPFARGTALSGALRVVVEEVFGEVVVEPGEALREEPRQETRAAARQARRGGAGDVRRRRGKRGEPVGRIRPTKDAAQVEERDVVDTGGRDTFEIDVQLGELAIRRFVAERAGAGAADRDARARQSALPPQR